MDMILNEKDSNEKIVDYFNRHKGVKYAHDTTAGFYRIYFDSDNNDWNDFFITTILLMDEKPRSEWIKHLDYKQKTMIIGKMI
jgi:hypothetical protein